ncbi:hypothetical protein YH65_04780 [Sulfurovum lithotrophicum]|uniref:Uncharacterized protein n=1 Tax=Sulfurovum lithotrophicum TaxID=206403 RepID=A0A7U4M0T0_9BACT|nr:hypothetical protein YH65_04780 [Sulfurovum lithotrophicum]
MLIRDDSGNIFDRRKGRITVYTLKNFKVSSVKFIALKDLDAICWLSHASFLVQLGGKRILIQ